MSKINVILFGVSKINVIFATCKNFYTPQRYEKGATNKKFNYKKYVIWKNGQKKKLRR